MSESVAELLLPPDRYLVVGSAPTDTPIIPTYLDGRVIIAANGAAYAHDFDADILCTTTHLFREDATPREVGIQGRIFSSPSSHRHRTYSKAYIDTRNHPGSIGKVFESLRETAIRNVHPDLRDETVLAALDRAQDPRFHRHEEVGKWLRVSTGVWAICLAVASVSPSILAVGINPDSQGHYGMDDKIPGPPRDHVEEDRAVLQVLENAGLVEILR